MSAKSTVEAIKLQLEGRIARDVDGNVWVQAHRPWLPISTAPKDGSDILVFMPGATEPPFTIAHWSHCEEDPSGDDWYETFGGNPLIPAPSHWTPLPDPPEGA